MHPDVAAETLQPTTDGRIQPGNGQAQFDLFVYGATPAGIFAAIAAARNGLSTVIVEPTALCGGLVASGLNATDIGGPKVIRGMVREFYERCGKAYGTDVELRPESKVASRVFLAMLMEAGVRLILNKEVTSLIKVGARIKSCKLEDGSRIEAGMFVDATYEGDLLPLANISFHVGREPQEQYNETHAGVTSSRSMLPYPGVRSVSAIAGDGRLLHFLTPPDHKKPGSGDHRLQAYSFRLSVTDDPGNRVSFPEPDSYNPADFELFRRLVQVAPADAHQFQELFPGAYRDIPTFRSGYFNMAGIAGGKRDVNSGHLVSLNLPGINNAWIDASREGRSRVYQAYRNYTLGLWHFVMTDPAVPASVKAFMGRFGLCADEFLESGHFPPMLYIREARRMIGAAVYNENDIANRVQDHANAIAIARYHLDCKPAQWTTTKDGEYAVREGMFFFNPNKYYLLPFSVILPRQHECENLLVPVCVSASHVGYSSIRMEPHWMQLGEAAGHTVSLALRHSAPVQAVPVAAVQSSLKLTVQELRAASPLAA